MTERRLYVTRPPPTDQRSLDLWLQQVADEINSLPSFLGTDSGGSPVLGVQADTILEGDEGQVLRSGASESAWSTATFPDDATAGDLLHASGNSTWASLAKGTARQLLQMTAGATLPEWTSNVDVPGTLDVTGAAVLDSTLAVTGSITQGGVQVVLESRTLTGGDGIETLGDLSADRTVSVDLLASGGLDFTAGELGVDEANVDHDALSNFVANEHVDHSAVTLTAGSGLTGGGDITASRTFNVAALTEENLDGALNARDIMYTFALMGA